MTISNQQLGLMVKQRVHAEFSFPFNRIQDAVDRLRVSQANPEDVFRAVGELQAKAMEASGEIIWSASKTFLVDSKVRYQPGIDRQLASFVLSLVSEIRKKIEGYCRGVITATGSPLANATWVTLANSLNRNEQAVRDILQSRVLEYVKELYLASQVGGTPPVPGASVGPHENAPRPSARVDELDRFDLDLDLRPAPRPAPQSASMSAVAAKRVFVVHGHNDQWRELLTAQLIRLGCDPIVLREHAEQGQTIIEKFEQYSDVAFAVVLVTADDEGRARSAATELQPRARQNVILELGYFMGKLGRHRVCVLAGDFVDLPSDFTGVLNIPLDTGGLWKQRLARELLTAGFNFEPSKLV